MQQGAEKMVQGQRLIEPNGAPGFAPAESAASGMAYNYRNSKNLIKAGFWLPLIDLHFSWVFD